MGCAGTAALDAGPMHFSLLLSPEGRAPVWPRLDGRGRTVWPEGEEALHRAAYTFVALEPEANRFTFDLFLHEGSRASAWALSAPLGTKVAVMGPGGGDLPDAGEILLAGDETALPAIRRILETSAADRRGRVLIEIGDDGDRMPLRAPEQVEVTWLRRHAGETLLAALRAVDLDPDAPPPTSGWRRSRRPCGRHAPISGATRGWRRCAPISRPTGVERDEACGRVTARIETRRHCAKLPGPHLMGGSSNARLPSRRSASPSQMAAPSSAYLSPRSQDRSVRPRGGPAVSRLPQQSARQRRRAAPKPLRPGDAASHRHPLDPAEAPSPLQSRRASSAACGRQARPARHGPPSH